MKDVQNRERTAPAKPLVVIGELQFDYVKLNKKNVQSNKKSLFRPLHVNGHMSRIMGTSIKIDVHTNATYANF